MTISEFIYSRQHSEYSAYYFNYDILITALNNLSELEKEKAYGFNFTIIESDLDHKYKVIPSISNENFKDSYDQFLKILSCEIDRVDLIIDQKLNELYRKVDEIRINLLSNNQQSYLSWFNFSSDLEKDASAQLYRIESELKLFLKSVVPLNKFALSKLLDFKQQFLGGSNYHHLLLEVELGYQVPPKPKFFPKAGKNNRYNFYSTDSEKSDILVTPTDAAPTLLLPLIKVDQLDSVDSKTNTNTLCRSTYLNLPTPTPISNRNQSACSFTNSISNLSSSSNLSSNSNYSKSSLCKNTHLFTTTSQRIKSLLGLVKKLRFKFNCDLLKVKSIGYA